MDAQELQLSQRHQTIVDHFVAACRADKRVVAAFLGGSYARGAADAYSDLDFYVITAEGAYTDFLAERAAFVRHLGEPVFLEDFDEYGFDLILFIFSDGTEGELALGREGGFHHIHAGPHVVLLDKTGILAETAFPEPRPSPAEQVDRLRGLVNWFWHDLSHHFLTPLGRGQLWTAFGGLEELRRTCVDLARLAADFTIAPEGYEKVERAIPAERLAPLVATACPPQRGPLLLAAHAIVGYYREVVTPLAQAHSIMYPTALDRVICARLDALDDTPSTSEPSD
ncbi:MAG TPA: nucleotidyltransferase domain-containing protein [Ktedonobacterales bacterium]|nr:nucleotidyltransferase domain-containing protein [Ktedonobacterales bacterium]